MKTIYVIFRRVIILLLIVLLVNSLFAQLTPEEKQRINEIAQNLKNSVKNLPDHEKKISSLILQSIRQMDEAGAEAMVNTPEIVQKFSTPALKTDEQGRLDVYLVLSDESGRFETEKVINIIKQHNGIIKSYSVPKPESKWMPEIYCWIPFAEIKELAKLTDVKSILPSPIRVSRIGDYLTEGFTQLKADIAQQHYNVTGQGVKVGVISTGVEHWDISRQSGDFPSNIHHNNCQVPDDEGTAMLEIVYDMAEGADLYFRGIAKDDEPTDMRDRILELQSVGCRVIVDDIGWTGVPFFQDDDELCQTVRAVIVDDRSYISAAGNNAENLWGGYFEGDANDWLKFDGQNIGNKVTMENGDKIRLELQWANDWNDATDDFDVYLYNRNNTSVVAYGNQTSNTPQEILQYTNNTGQTDDFYIRVKKSSGWDIELKLLGNMYDSNNNRKPCVFNIQYPSGYDHPVNQIYGHAAVQDVISVAAYSAFNLDELEPYSSRGPTNVYIAFDPPYFVTRETPTITATDSVATKIGSTQYWPELFPGTSAAAPHIAGIAALYYEYYPTHDPEDFLNDLTSSAESFGNYGNPGQHNIQSGYGRADALQVLGGILGVEVHQLNQAGSNTGEFEHWGGSAWEPPYTAPYTFDNWQPGSDQTLRAEQDVWYGEKFQYWNEEDSVINHDTFPISEETDLLFAQLNGISEATVRNYFISAPGANPEDDHIDFKDPWLIDYDDAPYGMRNRGMSAPLIPYSSPLNLTTGSAFKGVFLNQPYTGTNPVHYTVRAQQEPIIPFHNENFSWTFKGWDGTSVLYEHPEQTQTAVVFQQPGAVAQAVYKGKLASSSSEAIAGNGACKIWSTESWGLQTYSGPGYRIVYEDNGDIYYTEFIHNYGTFFWEDEYLVSDGSGNSKYPSIAVTEAGRVCIVWQRYSPATGNYSIKYREKVDYVWNAPQTITTSCTSPQSTPVVGVSAVTAGYPETWTWTIVWFNGDYLKYCHVDMNGEIINLSPVPTTDANSKNPTITNDSRLEHGLIGIAWEKSGQIWFWELYCSDPSSPIGIYPMGDPENVSQGFHLLECHNPSITYSEFGQNTMLTWHSKRENFNSPEKGDIPDPYIDPDEQYRINARNKEGFGEWGGLRSISYDQGHHNYDPAIGAVNNQDYRLLWKIDNSDLVAQLDYLEGEGWNFDVPIVTHEGAGINNPSISSGGSDKPATVWSKYQDAPFRMEVHTVEQPSEMVSKGNTFADHQLFREATFDLTALNSNLEGNVSLIFSEFYDPVSGKRIPFAPDSLEKSNFMGSSVFKSDSSFKKVAFDIWIWGHGIKIRPGDADMDRDILSVVLKEKTGNTENGSNKILKLIKSFKPKDIVVNHNGSFIIQDQIILDLSKYQNTDLLIDTDYLPNIVSNGSLSFVETFCATGNSGKINTASEKMDEALISGNEAPPEQYLLYPAYPNPFNPSTTISFDLPEDSPVSLEIFDVSGRKIRTLANNFYSAGSHQAVWDGLDDHGNQAATGVYVYRIQAGKFIQSRKMLMMK